MTKNSLDGSSPDLQMTAQVEKNETKLKSEHKLGTIFFLNYGYNYMVIYYKT